MEQNEIDAFGAYIRKNAVQVDSATTPAMPSQPSGASAERNAVLEECISALTALLGRMGRNEACGRNAVFDSREVIKSLKSAAPVVPAGVQEPVGEVVMYPNYSTVVHWFPVMPPSGTKLYTAPAPPLAQPVQPHPVFAFLDGSGPLDGVQFGEKHPTEKGSFWWRKHLRAALAANLAQPVQDIKPWQERTEAMSDADIIAAMKAEIAAIRAALAAKGPASPEPRADAQREQYRQDEAVRAMRQAAGYRCPVCCALKGELHAVTCSHAGSA